MTLGEFVAPDCDPGPLAARVGISLIGPSYPFCSNRRAERGEHYEWRRLRRRRLAWQTGPCFARNARGRGRALAPARFARLIARARQSAHFSCPFLRWF